MPSRTFSTAFVLWLASAFLLVAGCNLPLNGDRNTASTSVDGVNLTVELNCVACEYPDPVDVYVVARNTAIEPIWVRSDRAGEQMIMVDIRPAGGEIWTSLLNSVNNGGASVVSAGELKPSQDKVVRISWDRMVENVDGSGMVEAAPGAYEVQATVMLAGTGTILGSTPVTVSVPFVYAVPGDK